MPSSPAPIISASWATRFSRGATSPPPTASPIPLASSSIASVPKLSGTIRTLSASASASIKRTSRNPGLTVVGVVPNIARENQSPGKRDPIIYLPFRQQINSSMFVVARTSVPPATLKETFRQKVQAIDDGLPAMGLRTMNEQLERQNWPHRIFGSLLAILALIALGLALLSDSTPSSPTPSVSGPSGNRRAHGLPLSLRQQRAPARLFPGNAPTRHRARPSDSAPPWPSPRSLKACWSTCFPPPIRSLYVRAGHPRPRDRGFWITWLPSPILARRANARRSMVRSAEARIAFSFRKRIASANHLVCGTFVIRRSNEANPRRLRFLKLPSPV